MAASSENLQAAIDDPFLLRQSFSDMCWPLNPPPDNEKALYGNHHHDDFSLLLLLQPDHHDQSFSSSADLGQQTTHPTPDPKRRIAAAVKSRMITKRKSRATKKNQTTFITADPANFRQMVQQVTGGIRLDTTSSTLSHLLLKPETTTTRRPIGRYACQLLPTLDTSSFLLEQQQQQISQSSVMASSSGALVDGETGYGASTSDHGFGIASFPTLESWKVM